MPRRRRTPKKKTEIVSAQAIVRTASARPIQGASRITSENLADFVPDTAAALSASVVLRTAGFDIGPLVGIGFSVAGPMHLFERFLGVRLRKTAQGGLEFVVAPRQTTGELVGTLLPETLRASLTALVLPRPPDFGPTEFG